MMNGKFSTRNLRKDDLGGVIFGCTRATINECLTAQIFGLPGQHMSYVQNIEPGLPLFLFNYSDKKLLGIFEAESCGQLNINPYGWSTNGSERTKYPAQVRIRTRMRCEPLLERHFKPIIADNYHSTSRFCFEVDCRQANALMSLFGSSPIPKVALNLDAPLEVKNLTPSSSEEDFRSLDLSNMNPRGVSTDTVGISKHKQLLETHFDREEMEIDEQIIYLNLNAMSFARRHTESSSIDYEADTIGPCNTNSKQKEYESTPETLPVAGSKNEDISIMDPLSAIHQAEPNLEIQRLKDRVELLESQLDPSTTCTDETLHLESDELIFLLGGYDGRALSSALDCYSLSRDVLRSLQPMSAIRSHAAAAVLNGHIYIFGGGDGDVWYDTVESYNPCTDKWTSCPPLSVDKGNLAAVTLHGKVYGIGGGNRESCFSDVEMFAPSLGWWVHSQSMLEKRFAPASAVLNGALYAVGGYDGEKYLKSAERFDPRAISWENVPSMNTRRGCHSLVAFKEKLYACGGYDGTSTVANVEVLDPRFGSWTNSGPMNQPRAYAGAVVIAGSIYVIGGVQSGSNLVDTVECYKDGSGWLLTRSTAINRRCFFSAVVL